MRGGDHEPMTVERLLKRLGKMRGYLSLRDRETLKLAEDAIFELSERLYRAEHGDTHANPSPAGSPSELHRVLESNGADVPAGSPRGDDHADGDAGERRPDARVQDGPGVRRDDLPVTESSVLERAAGESA